MKKSTGCLFLIGFLAPSASLFAQIDKGSIVGRVQDSSGSSVVGSAIQIVRVSTNQVFKTVTTDTGDYSVVDLPADVYSIRASSTGFKTSVPLVFGLV